ncbi:MAG: gamma-glutamyl-gamma-aminobutyrate hydrolase family protein [Nanoarchaeota archaeon]|nr:gamma-glutamyl-gamma-aminobutyrate hydrolase family protein [Nanoarchaeota archaeon]
MLVAISQRNDKNKHGDYVDNLENNYVNYLEKCGIKLIVIPNCVKDLGLYFDELPIEGLILTGGNMVNPALYEGKVPSNSDFSEIRDSTEKKMIEIAIEKKLPVLGICRGMQFINVFFGGKLVSIKDEVKDFIGHVAVTHNVNVMGDKANFLGKSFETNSYHNYGFIEGGIGENMVVFAKTSDSVVEGIYHQSLPIVGIEWHPERRSPDEGVNEKIVRAFINKDMFWKSVE